MLSRGKIYSATLSRTFWRWPQQMVNKSSSIAMRSPPASLQVLYCQLKIPQPWRWHILDLLLFGYNFLGGLVGGEALVNPNCHLSHINLCCTKDRLKSRRQVQIITLLRSLQGDFWANLPCRVAVLITRRNYICCPEIFGRKAG